MNHRYLIFRINGQQYIPDFYNPKDHALRYIVQFQETTKN